jgi:hypothetical protein
MKSIGSGIALGWLLLMQIHCGAHRTGLLANRHTEPVPPSPRAQLASASFPTQFNTAETGGGPGFRTFRCEFSVPGAPAFNGQSIYLWCGVQQASGVAEKKDFGVLQPVLMFGPDCVQSLPPGKDFGPDNDPDYQSKPYWYYSAQYVYPDPTDPDGYRCTSGEVVKAIPGEILVSTMTYDIAADAMTVRISSSSGGRASSLTALHPRDDRSKSWRRFMGRSEILLEGALEIPNPDAKQPMPPEIFRGFLVKAKVTPSPQFPFLGATPWQMNPNPENTLSVRCVHNASILGSDCTWSRF